MGEAVEGYLQTVASVKRKDIGEAVAEFLQADAPRTKAADGQRAQLSGKYAYNRKLQLNRFADTFPNTAVSELSREHLDKFIGSLNEFSAKSRNHYRAAVRQFLQWATVPTFGASEPVGDQGRVSARQAAQVSAR